MLLQKLDRIISSLSVEQEELKSSQSSSGSAEGHGFVISSGDVSELLDSQDLSLVNMMAEDSILSTQAPLDGTTDGESDEEIEMSQAIWDCSGLSEGEEHLVSGGRSPLPQLDGTFDDIQPATSGIGSYNDMANANNSNSHVTMQSSIRCHQYSPRLHTHAPIAQSSYDIHDLQGSSQFSSSQQPPCNSSVSSFYGSCNHHPFNNTWNASTSNGEFALQSQWQTRTFSGPSNEREYSSSSCSMDYTLCVNEIRPPSQSMATNCYTGNSPNCSEQSKNAPFVSNSHCSETFAYYSDTSQSNPFHPDNATPMKANPRTEFIRYLKRRKLSLNSETASNAYKESDFSNQPSTVAVQTKNSKRPFLSKQSTRAKSGTKTPRKKPKKIYKRKPKLTLDEFYTELLCDLPGKALNVLLLNGVYLCKYVPTESLIRLGTEQVVLTRLESDELSDVKTVSGKSENVCESNITSQQSVSLSQEFVQSKIRPNGLCDRHKLNSLNIYDHKKGTNRNLHNISSSNCDRSVQSPSNSICDNAEEAKRCDFCSFGEITERNDQNETTGKDKIVIKIVRSRSKVKKNGRKRKRKDYLVVASSSESGCIQDVVNVSKKGSLEDESDIESSSSSTIILEQHDETFDEHLDVMWKLSYYSPASLSPYTSESPPRSWSPSDPKRFSHSSQDACDDNSQTYERLKEVGSNFHRTSIGSHIGEFSSTEGKLKQLKSPIVIRSENLIPENSQKYLIEAKAGKKNVEEEIGSGQSRGAEKAFPPFSVEVKIRCPDKVLHEDSKEIETETISQPIEISLRELPSLVEMAVVDNQKNLPLERKETVPSTSKGNLNYKEKNDLRPSMDEDQSSDETLTPSNDSFMENPAGEKCSLLSRDVYSFYEVENDGNTTLTSIAKNMENCNCQIDEGFVIITPALYPPSCAEILIEQQCQKSLQTNEASSLILRETIRDYKEKIASKEVVSIAERPEPQKKGHSLLQKTSKSIAFTPPKAKDVLSPLGPHRLNRTISVEVHHEDEEHQHLTIMSVEIHVETRNELRPDPKHDPVNAIFFAIKNDASKDESTQNLQGAILVDTSGDFKFSNLNDNQIWLVKSELQLFELFIDLLKRWNPDMVCGYDLKMLSWGYILDRALQLEESLVSQFSRIHSDSNRKPAPVNRQLSQESMLESEYFTEIDIKGRVVLNLWKIMRNEVAFNSYTFENIFYHALHQRLPVYSFKKLTDWFKQPLTRWRVMDYYSVRVSGNLKLLDHFNIVQRTSEFARIFGIQFFEVFSRGSQFRVESVMLRMTKALGYIPVSPSPHQRARSRAPECLQLIMEPESKFYTDPVVVLDFQSLYPSIIIAYNYCYSTCLGRLEHLDKKGPFDFGCVTLDVAPSVLKKLDRKVTISPTGVVFVDSSIRKGVLPRMLEEILKTRIMVKKAMKDHKDNKALKKRLDSQQMGLKLLANVSYGYTAANYSGRMPCVEVGDSIVSKARETLERAIYLVENRREWEAHVVYGDTDSMFVHLPGRSREEAFQIGQEIADVVTAANPKPIKLKFEKVYQPCLLQTKKRYVGFMYETSNQEEPVLDAKGIETIRRDNCPAVKKILERSIRILFGTHDASLAKCYVQRQFQKILTDRLDVREFVFAKEYRGRSGYRPNACVPALEIAKRLTQNDPRAEPQAGERVPYVIVYGAPGLPLIKLIHQPLELLGDSNLRINTQYYITRVIIPPLERVFSLLSERVDLWFSEMPRLKSTDVPRSTLSTTNQKGSLTRYFASADCASCGEPSSSALCTGCRDDPHGTVVALAEKVRAAEREVANLKRICSSCSGFCRDFDSCISVDCPILFRLSQARKDSRNCDYLRRLLSELSREGR